VAATLFSHVAVPQCPAADGKDRARTYKTMYAPPALAQARQGRSRLAGWPTAAAVGKRQLLTVQPASAGDRVAYSRRLFMSALPGFVSCTASSSHGALRLLPYGAATRSLQATQYTVGDLRFRYTNELKQVKSKQCSELLVDVVVFL